MRMMDRSLRDAQVKMALNDGERIQKKKGEYDVKWNKWTIAVFTGNCVSLLLREDVEVLVPTMHVPIIAEFHYF